MSDKLKNPVVGVTHQLESIEKLIENKEFVSALAEIREVLSSVSPDSVSLETGNFFYLSAKVFRHFRKLPGGFGDLSENPFNIC